MQFVDTNIFINPIDFEDALTVAAMERQKISELYSYDKDFDRIKDSEITRLEPLHTTA